MLPRLGKLFPNAIEVLSKPRQEYLTMAYAELGLPKAPAIMAGSTIIIEGRDIDESSLEKVIRHHLDLPDTDASPLGATVPAIQIPTKKEKEDPAMNTTASDHELVDLTVRLSARMVAALHDTVTVKGIDLNTLIAGYVRTGLEHDLPEVHKKCFFTHAKEILKQHNVPEAAIEEIVDKFGY